MKLAAKLDDLIAASVYPVTSSGNDYDGVGSKSGRFGALRTKTGLTVVDKHIDVHEEGFIIIPCKELSDDWSNESDMLSFRSLDRPFVFPGEQVHIIACLTPSKQEQAEEVLMRFKKSHFFARIAEADEALWSRRKPEKAFQGSTSTIGGKFIPIESSKDAMLVDSGSLDASTSGGLVKNDVKCTLLANGDIVVLLQINIGVDSWKDPVLEILQFEKYQSTTLSYETSENIDYSKRDPYGDLLKWLLPVQNSVSPPRFVSSVDTSPSATARNSLTRPNPPSSLGSQNFLLGQFRSHSMSSLSSQSGSRLNNGLDDWDQVSSNSSGIKRSVEGLLSYRGVPLEPERFSVRCGLEGIYIPGRRWRRKVVIVHPLEVHCFAADCNTKDLLCIQIKNVSPAHLPDIVIYLDAITVIFEEASKGGPSLSSPVACVETGKDHGLPGLALRKGEEHSFILKPATPLWSSNAPGDKSVYIFSSVDRGASPANKYAVLVSCRSNYTESRLLFKQPTNWRPRLQKDILISVASQMSRHTIHSDDRIPNLPVQVLTLHASNLTNEDLTLTFLAPPSFSSPSVLSLTSAPPSPVSPFDEPVGVSGDRQSIALQRLWSASKALLNPNSGDDRERKFGSFNEKTDVISDILPKSDLACTHMWLKSRVPLGCVPSRSTVTVKLELLPLTDGIITLDSLQINVEQGPSYIPEHPLKINATSSVHIGPS